MAITEVRSETDVRTIQANFAELDSRNDGITATEAELNIMDGVTATTAEINLSDGVIEMQLNRKTKFMRLIFGNHVQK